EAQTGKPPAGATVPPENVQFVQRFQSRMTPRTVARGTPPRTGTYNGADTSSAGAQAPTNDQEAGAATPESATVERDRGNDSSAQQPKPPPDTARDTIPR
ncbi:MAG TPA: hypothetical protein VJS39_10860, partial [Gemmatimonadaceae bacterium]|nr:hypothetical protein [Gemmatimonadaceae bacterium]